MRSTAICWGKVHFNVIVKVKHVHFILFPKWNLLQLLIKLIRQPENLSSVQCESNKTFLTWQKRTLITIEQCFQGVGTLPLTKWVSLSFIWDALAPTPSCVEVAHNWTFQLDTATKNVIFIVHNQDALYPLSLKAIYKDLAGNFYLSLDYGLSGLRLGHTVWKNFFLCLHFILTTSTPPPAYLYLYRIMKNCIMEHLWMVYDTKITWFS